MPAAHALSSARGTGECSPSRLAERPRPRQSPRAGIDGSRLGFRSARARPQTARLASRERLGRTRLRVAGDDDLPLFAPIDVENEEGLGGTTEERFGPDAILSVGLEQQENATVRRLLDEMGAGFVAVIPCSSPMLDMTLASALERPALSGLRSAGARRTIFLSGMSGAEAVDVIGACEDAGLARCVFAALVPMNANKRVRDLVEEVHGDDVKTRARNFAP